MDYDPSLLHEDDSRDFEKIVDIKESTGQLITALQIEREPEIERYILSFGSPDTSEPIDVPNFIRRNLQPDTHVMQLWIDASINRLINQGELGLYISAQSIDGNPVIVGVTVDQSEDHTAKTALAVGEDDLPILEPASSAELNRFLASLFTQNKTGDYSAFDNMDLSNIEILERLLDALVSSSSESITHKTYVLANTLSPIADCIEYTEQDGTPVQCDITAERRGKASKYEINLSEYPEDATIARIAEGDAGNPEFLMQALDGIRTYDQDIDGLLTQIPSTNDNLSVLEDFIAEKTASVFSQRPEEALQPAHDVDPSLTINIEDTEK